MRAKNIHCFFIALFILIGCEEKISVIEPGQSSDKIILSSVGNRWCYVDSCFTQEGVLEYVDKLTIEVTGTKNINYEGQCIEAYQWICNYGRGKKNKFFARDENDGMNIFRYEYKYRKQLIFKYPIQNGETWRSDYYYCNCIATNKEISTKFGNVDCIEYKYYHDENYVKYIYLVKSMGIIGHKVFINGVMVEKTSLESYDFNIM